MSKTHYIPLINIDTHLNPCLTETRTSFANLGGKQIEPTLGKTLCCQCAFVHDLKGLIDESHLGLLINSTNIFYPYFFLIDEWRLDCVIKYSNLFYLHFVPIDGWRLD